MIRLFVTDMDHTFLDHTRHYDRQRFGFLLSALHHRNIRFAIATGNQRERIDEYFKGFSIDGMIAENGPYIISKEKVLEVSLFPDGTAESLIRYLDNIPELHLTICTPTKAYMLARDNPDRIKLMQEYCPALETVDSLIAHAHRLIKISISCPKSETKTLSNQIKTTFPEQLYATSSGFGNIDLIQPGKDKAHGLQVLSNYLGIPLSDSCVFGDGQNDMTMMQIAGTSVAVANADPQVLATATHTTKAADESGVLNYIERYLKQISD